MEMTFQLSSRARNRPLIVLVDDSEDDVFLTRRAIEGAGLRVDVASFYSCRFARDALELVGKGDVQMPLLVLLDIKLPGESGFDLLQWIRGEAELRALPVVVASSSTAPPDVARAADLGACAYVGKTSDAVGVVQAIRWFLAHPSRAGVVVAEWNLLSQAGRS
jgi:two-component system, chemotaxis family, response regulator Rcp1